MYNFFILLLLHKFPLIITTNSNGEDIFRQDIGDKMEIGLSDKGYKTVELRCGSNSMDVNVETDDEFLGVIYTRGSFYDKKSPCFYDATGKRGRKSFRINIPFDKCKTIKDSNNIYSNVLVLQHNEQLIMPGDAAFHLECDFSKPKDVTVTAEMHSIASRITLVDADPAKQVGEDNKVGMFESYTNSVIITPEALRLRKEEL